MNAIDTQFLGTIAHFQEGLLLLKKEHLGQTFDLWTTTHWPPLATGGSQ